MQFIFWVLFLSVPAIILLLLTTPRHGAHRITKRCTIPNDPTALRCSLPRGHTGPCFIEVLTP